MLDFVIILLNEGKPSRKLGHRLGCATKPRQSSMICANDDMYSQEVLPEVLQSMYDTEEFLASDLVLLSAADKVRDE